MKTKMTIRKNDHGELLLAVPGIVIDSNDDLRFVVKSDVAIGVTIKCFDKLYTLEQFSKVLTNEPWAVVFRHCQDEVFLLKPIMNIQPMPEHVTPKENEAAQFAIELALHAWKKWSPGYSTRFTPRVFVPFTTGIESNTEN